MPDARLNRRAATERDLQALCRFPQNEDELFFCFPKATFPLTPERLREALAPRAEPTVVTLDGEVAAFADFYRWERGGRCAIGHVIVSPAARGQGVGRFLIAQMTALAFSQYDASEVTVACFNHNAAGLLLYPRLGFQPCAIEERQDWQGRRVALIHLRLPRPQGVIP